MYKVSHKGLNVATEEVRQCNSIGKASAVPAGRWSQQDESFAVHGWPQTVWKEWPRNRITGTHCVDLQWRQGIQYGIEKCATIKLQRGKVKHTEGIVLPTAQVTREVKEDGYMASRFLLHTWDYLCSTWAQSLRAKPNPTEISTLFRPGVGIEPGISCTVPQCPYPTKCFTNWATWQPSRGCGSRKIIIIIILPSVLWRSLLGSRKGIQPVKKLSGGMLAWLGVWVKVQICIWPSWCHCHSLSLVPVNPDWFDLSGAGSHG